MHIELIGSTSAGKTTLAKKMVEAGKNSGIDVSLSDDFILDQLHLGWVKNDFIRRRLVEIVAFGICLTCMSRYQDFLRFVVNEGKSSPGSLFYKFNRVRNVIRKIGIFEYISRNSESKQIVLADNEGILQGVHNLFVHRNSQTNLNKIVEYVELVPLPDIVLYIQQNEEVLISRTLGRGHARVARNDPDQVAYFIGQAITVFNELVSVPKVRERLLIVEDGSKVRTEPGNLFDAKFHRVAELVQSGC